jgi:membrane protein implicated in regulation of membrane protease activity
MKCNSGWIDRGLRVIAGLVLLALTFTGTVGVLGWIGVVPLLTGIFGVCPAYILLGINTCSIKK